MLVKAVNANLNELIELLNRMTEEQYQLPSKELSGSSIGQHIRHIIEMYQCLLLQYESGIINYDDRKRDIRIETKIDYALYCLEQIRKQVNLNEKPLVLVNHLMGSSLEIKSHYSRELLYNLEHSIHHQALIKVALMSFDDIEVAEYFGYAPSTIQFKKECAQ
jgi:hypothetical protein